MRKTVKPSTTTAIDDAIATLRATLHAISTDSRDHVEVEARFIISNGGLRAASVKETYSIKRVVENG